MTSADFPVVTSNPKSRDVPENCPFSVILKSPSSMCVPVELPIRNVVPSGASASSCAASFVSATCALSSPSVTPPGKVTPVALIAIPFTERDSEASICHPSKSSVKTKTP